MSAQDEISQPLHGSPAGLSRSRSVATRWVLGPLAVVLVGVSTWDTTTPAPGPVPQSRVRLAAAVAPAGTPASCAAGWRLMTIPEVLRMIKPPTTADHVRATDVNRDNYLCVALSPNGFRITRYVDNLRESAGDTAACGGSTDPETIRTRCRGGDGPTTPA